MHFHFQSVNVVYYTILLCLDKIVYIYIFNIKHRYTILYVVKIIIKNFFIMIQNINNMVIKLPIKQKNLNSINYNLSHFNLTI